jgi:hypothetical protein
MRQAYLPVSVTLQLIFLLKSNESYCLNLYFHVCTGCVTASCATSSVKRYALEAWVPFLNRVLWEFASTLPFDVRLHQGQLKAILR